VLTLRSGVLQFTKVGSTNFACQAWRKRPVLAAKPQICVRAIGGFGAEVYFDARSFMPIGTDSFNLAHLSFHLSRDDGDNHGRNADSNYQPYPFATGAIVIVRYYTAELPSRCGRCSSLHRSGKQCRQYCPISWNAAVWSNDISTSVSYYLLIRKTLFHE
jgi:hypothetical protein